MVEATRRELLRGGLALATSSVMLPKAHALHAALAGPPGLRAAGDAAPGIGPRERLLMDFGWKFTLGHGSDPARDLGFGATQEDFAKTGAFEFATGKFDDSHWRALDLPHDWAVELPFVHDEGLRGHGYKPLGRSYPETSVGWYRRSFELAAADAGRRIVLEFDGVFRDARVFVNGCFVGGNDNGYVPFRCDITDLVLPGSRNFVVVRVDASFGDGWFYEGAGIYRHVWLTKTAALHLGAHESYVRTDVGRDEATLTLGTLVENQGAQVEKAYVQWRIVDALGKTVATARCEPQSIPVDGAASFTTTARLPTPTLWSPERPYLYSAIVSVETDAKTHDAEQMSFGVRTVSFDADKGFFLNGRSVKIKGTCNHQDHAGVGAALPDRLQEYRLAILREMGCNAVRTSHNMPTPEWVAACERTGVMMLCESRLMSSSPEGLAQLENMIKRYRNSPAVILWSLGNEEWKIQAEELGAHIVATMVRRAHELDPTRLCTAAINGHFGLGISRVLPIEGFNYNLADIEGYHRSHPNQPLLGTETASTVCTRGIYETDKLRNWVSAYDVNHTEWSELAQEWWGFYAAREYLPGGFAWTGFDYRGEPTPYGWPSINSQFGIVDLCGFPKDNFYYYKAWWGSEPVLHLFPHWDWQQRLGEKVSVWVHSNLDEVELFLNGRSQGRQKVSPWKHLEWQVKFEPGVIEARGSKNGKIVLTAKRETVGPPVGIRLTPDRDEIDADGTDISMVRVELVDSAGRHIPTADTLINFKITGEGKLLGVGNGDPNCQESDKEPKRSLFSGLAQVIVQASRTPGTIQLEATTVFPGPKLPTVTLAIHTRAAAARPTAS
jgi:beta-galactosidase